MDSQAISEIAAKTGGQALINGRIATITVKPEMLRDACAMVSSIPGLYHLSTITGIDTGEEIELQYHFWKEREFVSVRTMVGKQSPQLRTVSDVLPSAVLYEAEVHDMLGVLFQGNALMGRKLLLPDNYPKDAPPPLRKEANPEEIRRLMGLE